MLLKTTLNPDIINSIYKLDINAANLYITIQIDNKYVGMFELQEMTKITYIVHMHIKEEYQKQGLGPKAFKELLQYLKETSQIRKLIGSIPANNNRILSIVKKTSAKCCGLIKDGIIFKGVLQDLVLYELDLLEV